METSESTFLEIHDVRTLTGLAQKSKQVVQLKRMGIPFYINAQGLPIVARCVLEGSRAKPAVPNTRWRPAIDGT